MIEIKELNRKGLKEFIDSEEYNKMPMLPISRHRAISHINNPRADENDVLLLLAYYDNNFAAYLGILPDLINYDHKKIKCGWFSCIWTDARYRGKGLAKKLLERALILYEGKIIMTGFTEPAKQIYLKSNHFYPREGLKGIRLYSRSDLATILPPKKKPFPEVKASDQGI